MIGSIWAKSSACLLVAALGGSGIVAVIHQHGPAGKSTSSDSAAVSTVSLDHTAAWYVVHPDVLKQDEECCYGDSATISRNAFQNADSADEQLTQIQMQKAVEQNNASANAVLSNKSKPN